MHRHQPAQGHAQQQHPTPTPSSNKAVLASRRGKTNSDKCAQMSALTSANDKAITSSGSTVTLLISAASACQRDTAGHHAGLRQPGESVVAGEEVSPLHGGFLIKNLSQGQDKPVSPSGQNAQCRTPSFRVRHSVHSKHCASAGNQPA